MDKRICSNDFPLCRGLGIGFFAFVGISYSYIQKQLPSQSSSNEEYQTIGKGATPPVTPDDAITTSSLSERVGKSDEVDEVAPENVAQDLTDHQPPNEISNELSEAMKRRQQQLQQLEANRLAKLEEALNGDISVQGFDARRMDREPAGFHSKVDRRLSSPYEYEGMSVAGAMVSANPKDLKSALLYTSTEDDIYLNNRRKKAISQTQEIKAGWIIPAIMISGINSDLPGQIIGQVREAVYDSATGTQCLIPPGTRLFGTYDSGVTSGQNRALVAWQRLIYPDGSSLSIGHMPGGDVSGYAGFKDKVNNHYAKTFASGIMLSIFSAGVQLSQPQAKNGENYNSPQIIAGALGQQMGQLGMQMAQRNMNIPPTITIRPGFEFNIMVTKDIILPTWKGHPMADKNQSNC